MKKRFLFPLIGIGTLTALGVFGHSITSEQASKCNDGNWNSCQELLDSHSLHSWQDKITHPDWKPALKKHLAAKAEAEASKPVELVTLISRDKNRTLSSCRALIKASLKDPSSYREVRTDYAKASNTQLAVRVTYSATNSFGGRIQYQQACGV